MEFQIPMPADTDMSSVALMRMMAIAKSAHAGQKYGNKGDYYDYHILGVLAKLITLPEFKSATPYEQYTMMLMALGHDLIEDTDVTDERLLEEGFDPYVVGGIGLLSRDDDTPKDVYITRILADFGVTTVKKADTEFNYEQSVADGNERLIKKYTKQREDLKRNDEMHKRRFERIQ